MISLSIRYEEQHATVEVGGILDRTTTATLADWLSGAIGGRGNLHWTLDFTDLVISDSASASLLVELEAAFRRRFSKLDVIAPMAYAEAAGF